MKIIEDDHVYSPEIFNSFDIESAKEIIVTAESDGSFSTKERWEKETPFLVNEIGKYLHINSETIVLDYGCGIDLQNNICEIFEELERQGDYLPDSVASVQLNATSIMQLLRKRE